MSDTAALVVRGLQKTFVEADRKLTVLDGVELTVERGARLAIVGASGSGKTTLLQLLGGLDEPTAGEVWVSGACMSTLGDAERGRLRNRALGFVYQFHHLLPEFSALENVVLPQMIAGLGRAEAKRRAMEVLSYLRVDNRADHRPGQLSGGEQQRVAIARAVANAPRLLLADEPTGNLDPTTAGHVFSALRTLVRESGLAALIATHNYALAAEMDRTVTIQDGAIVAARVE